MTRDLRWEHWEEVLIYSYSVNVVYPFSVTLRYAETKKPILRLGLYSMLAVEKFCVFSGIELESLLCGKREIDIEDWKKHTGGYNCGGITHYIVLIICTIYIVYTNLSTASETVVWFWKAVVSVQDDIYFFVFRNLSLLFILATEFIHGRTEDEAAQIYHWIPSTTSRG